MFYNPASVYGLASRIKPTLLPPNSGKPQPNVYANHTNTFSNNAARTNPLTNDLAEFYRKIRESKGGTAAPLATITQKAPAKTTDNESDMALRLSQLFAMIAATKK